MRLFHHIPQSKIVAQNKQHTVESTSTLPERSGTQGPLVRRVDPEKMTGQFAAATELQVTFSCTGTPDSTTVSLHYFHLLNSKQHIFGK